MWLIYFPTWMVDFVWVFMSGKYTFLVPWNAMGNATPTAWCFFLGIQAAEARVLMKAKPFSLKEHRGSFCLRKKGTFEGWIYKIYKSEVHLLAVFLSFPVWKLMFLCCPLKLNVEWWYQRRNYPSLFREASQEIVDGKLWYPSWWDILLLEVNLMPMCAHATWAVMIKQSKSMKYARSEN